jgi:O-antigen ligase
VPAPEGFGTRVRSWVALGAMIVVLIADARLTNNRIVWFALLLLVALVPALCALRWRRRARVTGWRWLVPIAGVAVLIAVGFADTLLKRTELNYSPTTPVAEALAEDPRIPLWSHTWDKILERPLTGYGAGKKILAPELRRELGDPLLTHAHNVFISQWLQKGAIGLCAFAALLVGLLLQFVRFYRSRDDALALVGITGIAILSAMVVKNLTDDFLYGAYGRQFLCLMAVLLGYGMRRERGLITSAEDVAPDMQVIARAARSGSRAPARGTLRGAGGVDLNPES